MTPRAWPPPEPARGDVTRLLLAARDGDRAAFDQLFPFSPAGVDRPGSAASARPPGDGARNLRAALEATLADGDTELRLRLRAALRHLSC